MAKENTVTRAIPHIRPAAVAGMFYPASSAVLARDIREMLARADTSVGRPKAVIAPHAGYMYSGPIAANVYNTLSSMRDRIRRVVLLGPTHRVAIQGLALPMSTAFATPLGVVPIDREAMTLIEDLPQVVFSEVAHAQEHSLEVQLPFLQTVLTDFALVPLAVGRATPTQVAEVLERLWGGDETLVVVSSDLSHYLPYAEAHDKDRRTAQCVVALDAHLDHQQACGATPVNGLLLAVRRRGLTARLIDLRNSGDTAGDKSRVVGYGAFAFSEEDPDEP